MNEAISPTARDIPTPDAETSFEALKAMLRERHPYAAIEVFNRALGDVFRVNLPGFNAIFMSGPEASRFVLVEERDSFNWRNPHDPVTGLLREGMLVVDGEAHDKMRALMSPPLRGRALGDYVETMNRRTEEVLAGWADGSTVDMLVEMRKITLLVLMESLFAVDIAPELDDLWDSILAVIKYISPGVWMVWRGVPRPQFKPHVEKVDAYLYRIIRERRAQVEAGMQGEDILTGLISAGLSDDLVRDQVLTMMIAGHDTNTALLAWALALLGQHPEVMQAAAAEVDATIGADAPTQETANQLELVNHVLKEALRLYPPIHLGSRIAAADLTYNEYRIPAGDRVVYSIYLTQRDPQYWEDPAAFRPERHAERPEPYTWLPFGGGPRNCIGAGFGLLEAKVVLARILQQFSLELAEKHIRPRMAATLEPQPGVRMRVTRR